MKTIIVCVTLWVLATQVSGRELEHFKMERQLLLQAPGGFYGIEQYSWQTTTGRVAQSTISFGTWRYRVPGRIVPWRIDQPLRVGMIAAFMTLSVGAAAYIFIRRARRKYMAEQASGANRRQPLRF